MKVFRKLGQTQDNEWESLKFQIKMVEMFLVFSERGRGCRLQTKLFFFCATNEEVAASGLPALEVGDPWQRKVYVNESSACKNLARFRLGATGIGNKAPRAGRPYRTKWCPLCPEGTPSTEQHIVISCPAVDKERSETGLQMTINLGWLAGLDNGQIYFNLLNGLDKDGRRLSSGDFLDIGNKLGVLLDKWLDLW